MDPSNDCQVSTRTPQGIAWFRDDLLRHPLIGAGLPAKRRHGVAGAALQRLEAWVSLTLKPDIDSAIPGDGWAPVTLRARHGSARLGDVAVEWNWDIDDCRRWLIDLGKQRLLDHDLRDALLAQIVAPTGRAEKKCPTGLRRRVQEAFERCEYCGLAGEQPLTVDRIVPGAAGGRYVSSNVTGACWHCNVAKGASEFVGPVRSLFTVEASR